MRTSQIKPNKVPRLSGEIPKVFLFFAKFRGKQEETVHIWNIERQDNSPAFFEKILDGNNLKLDADKNEGEHMWLWTKSKRLQRNISLFILAISFFLLILSIFVFHMSQQNFKEAKRMEQTTEITRAFSKALRNLSLERTRMHVILHSRQPINTEDRSAIEMRRRLAADYLSTAFDKLTAIHPDLTENLARSLQILDIVRLQADTEAQKHGADRDPGAALHWLRRSMDFTYHVENVLYQLGRHHVNSTQFFLYHHLALDSIRFRQLVEYEASAMTTTLLQRPNDMRYMDEDLAMVKMQAGSLWSSIDMQVAELNQPNLTQAKTKVFVHYHNEYRPELERLLALSKWQPIDMVSIVDLQALAEYAFDTTYLLVDAAEQQMLDYVRETLVTSHWLLISGIAQLIGCFSLVVFGVMYCERRLFRPLYNAIHSLEQITNGETITVSNEELQRQDEFGQLNRGVQRLQVSLEAERRLLTENEQLAMTDFLTGCLNKRAFYLRAQAEIARAARESTTISFMFTDVDNMKLINDFYGHLIGDEAMKHFVSCITRQCRPYDLIGRFGGDEFVLCFPQTTEKQALKIAEGIRDALAKTPFQTGSSELLLEASFGTVSNTAGENRDVGWFIHQADMALYAAKRSGRNCVIVQDGEERIC